MLSATCSNFLARCVHEILNTKFYLLGSMSLSGWGRVNGRLIFCIFGSFFMNDNMHPSPRRLQINLKIKFAPPPPIIASVLTKYGFGIKSPKFVPFWTQLGMYIYQLISTNAFEWFPGFFEWFSVTSWVNFWKNLRVFMDQFEWFIWSIRVVPWINLSGSWIIWLFLEYFEWFSKTFWAIF